MPDCAGSCVIATTASRLTQAAGTSTCDDDSGANPSAREQISDLHRCEPYVYAQMIAGPEAYSHGEAKNSWLTGAATWNFVAITQWILGIRPDYDGLRVDPVLPASWPGFTATRRFRGATYIIRVTSDGAGTRVRDLVVNGQAVAGTLLPLAAPGTTVSVEAVATAGGPARPR